jgi:hypothetical protein
MKKIAGYNYGNFGNIYNFNYQIIEIEYWTAKNN